MLGYFIIAGVAVVAGLAGFVLEKAFERFRARRDAAAPENGRRASHVAFASPEHVEILSRLDDLRTDVEALDAKVAAAAPRRHHSGTRKVTKEPKEVPAAALAAPLSPLSDDGGWLSPTALACGDVLGAGEEV